MEEDQKSEKKTFVQWLRSSNSLDIDPTELRMLYFFTGYIAVPSSVLNKPQDD